MSIKLTRRQLLQNAGAASAALGAYALVPGSLQQAFALPANLTVSRRVIEVAGKPASVFGITAPNGAHGLTVAPGEMFQVQLANRIGEPTIVHWHGQTPDDYRQDGVAFDDSELIQADAVAAYDFAPRAGTHWMHSHRGFQEQQMMAAPLIVHTAEDLAADVQEAVVLFHDFTFRDPQEVFAGLAGSAMPRMPAGAPMPPPAAAAAGEHAGHGAMAGMMDLNDVDYDAFLANDRTLDDPFVVNAERGGRVRLRLINGATSSAFWIDTGALEGSVEAVDGNPVVPVPGRRFPMAIAQRLDILLTVPSEGGVFPIVATLEGERHRTGFVIATPGAAISTLPTLAETEAPPVDLSLEHRLSPLAGLAARPADVTHRVTLGGSMMPYVWTMSGRTWPERQPLAVRDGQRVVLELVNATMMAHPIHLHGHHFQVVGINGAPMSGAVRDTVLVPIGGTVAVAFDADNPGRWLLHCHNLYHMAAGMMTDVVYEGIV